MLRGGLHAAKKPTPGEAAGIKMHAPAVCRLRPCAGRTAQDLRGAPSRKSIGYAVLDGQILTSSRFCLSERKRIQPVLIFTMLSASTTPNPCLFVARGKEVTKEDRERGRLLNLQTSRTISRICALPCGRDMSWCSSSLESSLTPIVVCAFAGQAPQPAAAPAFAQSSPALANLSGAQMPVTDGGPLLGPDGAPGSVVMAHPAANASCLIQMPLPYPASETYPMNFDRSCFQTPAHELQCLQPADVPTYVGMGPAWQGSGMQHSHVATDLQLESAVQAASAATSVFGCGTTPLAAQQVSPGLWCVLVADPSYAGAAGLPPPAGDSRRVMVSTENERCPGYPHHVQSEHRSQSTLNLSLAEHLAPIPEAATAGCDGLSPSEATWSTALAPQMLEQDAPCTPPPRQRNVEILPTPSPVCLQSWKRGFQQAEKHCQKSKMPAFPFERTAPSSVEHVDPQKVRQVRGEVTEVAEPGLVRQVQGSKMSNSCNAGIYQQSTECTESSAAACRSNFGNPPPLQEPKHVAVPGYQHPIAVFEQGRYKRAPDQRWRKRGARQGPSASYTGDYTAWEVPHRRYRSRTVAQAAASTSLQADAPPDSLLERAIWDLMEQVLMQRPKLEEGKRVNVTLAKWLSKLSGSMCQQRALVNRALRTMTKRLPGCCWTVDFESQDFMLEIDSVLLDDQATPCCAGDAGSPSRCGALF